MSGLEFLRSEALQGSNSRRLPGLWWKRCVPRFAITIVLREACTPAWSAGTHIPELHAVLPKTLAR